MWLSAFKSKPSFVKNSSSVPKAVSIKEESISCFWPSLKTITSFPESWIYTFDEAEFALSP